MIDIAPLRQLLPANVYTELPGIMVKYAINTPLRLSHFLAQCAHESGNFKHSEENLNYSADRLLQVFPKYFNNDDVCLYARNPVIIASRVYANRMGNGDEDSGDGWRYKGRGYIQLTGKDNYSRFDLSVSDNIMSQPFLVAIKYPLESAAWFWNENKLNELADKGNTENEVALVTKKVNGGYNGLEDRTIHFKRLYNALA